MHTTETDGRDSIETMADAAKAAGLEYIAITDHTRSLAMANGLDERRALAHAARVRALNGRFDGLTLLAGIEVDILEDGSLDHADEVLAGLDLVVASVHSKLRMPEEQMSDRMLRAVASPHVDVLGHCTGRLIGKRDPSEFDAEAVFSACAAHRTAVEINCRPERLDPPEPLLQLAVALGCWFSIDSDAHSTGQLEWQPLGCDRAGAFGVPLDRVINTFTAPELLRWVAGR